MARKSQPILVVEDSEDDFEAIKRAFSKANLHNHIKHVYSGKDALSYLHGESAIRPSIILLDINMPGMDGRRTLNIIKQDQNLRTIPVVILTTSADERDVNTCYELGANTYIQKPNNYDELITAIQQFKEYWFETALLPKEKYHG